MGAAQPREAPALILAYMQMNSKDHSVAVIPAGKEGLDFKLLAGLSHLLHEMLAASSDLDRRYFHTDLIPASQSYNVCLWKNKHP